ncbi:NADH-quinone oxidoreductase subunit C [Lacibacter luteus]|uniref:NADH-quinone oxidoreductase n=1 Tax=Lacibacter luteus TaxID=2508719 RepID=A0A4Q1CFP3_9BACT|nr:NADH-quinone oxidoreductase subunit C [Lacibacter luteus]RXK58467.1 NADH-quinone oxidoreductase subunit C [Lacibacter luteus]
MTNEELKTGISELAATAIIDEADANGWLTVNIEATNWLSFAQSLRTDPALQFNFLFCLTCVDWKTHLTMVYHLRSTIYKHELVVKAKLDRNNSEIESVAHIWRTAEFHEREVYELFGVNFMNHPDLRLLILPDGWEGKKPLLKDFEDPINMIRL